MILNMNAIGQTKLLVQAQYFPPLGFFGWYGPGVDIYIDFSERFEKQTYRNRCCLLAADRVLNLTVPVQKGKTQCTTGQVGVVNQSPWARLHLRSMASCYGRAPFFEHYMPQLESVLGNNWHQLAQLNLATLRWAEKVLGLGPAQVLLHKPSIDDAFVQLHGALHPKREPGTGGAILSYKPYHQCFSPHAFVPGLSIIDLIMNQGPGASSYIPKWQGV